MEKEINQAATINRMKKLRLQKGYSQEKVAEGMGASRSYYSSIENGSREPCMIYLEKLAKFYNIGIDEICVFEETEYEKLEKLMDLIDKFRPTNYYMVRNGNLEDDIIDLINYFEESKITEYKLLDPLLNCLGYDVKLINIQAYIEKWNTASITSHNKRIKLLSKQLLSYFGGNNTSTCVLITKRNTRITRCLIEIDKYIEFEKFIYNSIEGNLESILGQYYYLYRATENEGFDDLDNIIKENISDEDELLFNNKYQLYSHITEHLQITYEYMYRLLSMEQDLKQKIKKNKNKKN